MNKVKQTLNKKGVLTLKTRKTKLKDCIYLNQEGIKFIKKFYQRNSANLISTVYQKHSPCNNQRCNLPNGF